MWLTFLQHPTAYNRPFLDFTKTLTADEIDLYSDASGKLGVGAICGSHWMYQMWDKEFLEKYRPSIEYLELYGVVVGVLNWIQQFKNRRIILFCDNKSVVDMINLTTTSCKNCMVLVRILVLKGLIENVRIFAKHIEGKKNVLADSLSRNNITLFHRKCAEQGRIMDSVPTGIPDAIWPLDIPQNLENKIINEYNNSFITGQRRQFTKYAESTGSKSSSTSSKISSSHINNILERLKGQQTRKSTSDNYLGIWRNLNKFLLDLDCKLLSSWEEKTALFGAYLVDKGVQSSTLKSYFSAIKHILKLDGYIWDDNKILLNSLVRSCKLENDTVKTRLPIQKGLLEMLLFEINRKYTSKSNQQPYLVSLYQAIFCLAYYGMMRVGELALGNHSIKACNIHVGNNKDKILIVLYSSKTHGKESRPQKVKISALPKKSQLNRFFCPFKIIIKYMYLRGSYKNEEEQFFVFSDKSPVRPNHIRNLLRELLDKLSLDGKLYDVHSFRGGRTVDLAKFGYSIDRIKEMGRWRSNAVYRYLKD